MKLIYILETIVEELRKKTKIGQGKDHVVYDFEHDPTKVIKVAWGTDSGGNRYDTNTKKTIVDFDPNHIKMFKKYPNLFAKVYKETNRYAIIEKLDVKSVREDEKELFNQISPYNFYDLQYMKEHNAINTLYWNITNRKGFLVSLIKKLEKNSEDLTLLNKYINLFKEINKTLKRIVRSVDVGSYNLGYDKDKNLKLLDF